jgi:RNA polymerase-binding transcription factor
MKKYENQRFQRMLENYRHEALQLLNRSENEARGLDDHCPHDTADLSVTAASKESLFQRSSGIRQLVRLIDAALHRIRTGTFGACVGCGDDIYVRRLKAVPWTEYCLRCQDALESGMEFTAECGARSHVTSRHVA